MNELVMNRNPIAARFAPALLAISLFGVGVAADTGVFEHRWDPAVGQPGTNGPVRALKVFDDGGGNMLYAGGMFTEAGGHDVSNLARWDGEQWHDVGGGVWGTPDTTPPSGGFVPVRAMTVHNGALYVAGDFTHAGPQDAPIEANRIARWDGKSWSAVGDGLAAGTIAAIASFQGALYVGGGGLLPTGSNGEPKIIARWDGTSWSDMPNDFVGWVSSIVPAEHGLDSDTGEPALYVGGDFYVQDWVQVSHVQRWDGESWSELPGDPFDVRALAIFNSGNGVDQLHVTHWADKVYRWTGDQWVQIPCWFGGTPHGCYESDGFIFALAAIKDATGTNLYAGGAFAGSCSGNSYNVARWDGAAGGYMHFGAIKTQWWTCASQVRAIAGFDDNGDGVESVYVAGGFDFAGPYPASNIAKAMAVPAPAQKCESPLVATLVEPTVTEENMFGCHLAFDGTTTLIRTCPIGSNQKPAAYFFGLIGGKWTPLLKVQPEEADMGGLAVFDDAAAIVIGGKTWIFERTRSEAEAEWSHAQTLDVTGSVAMHGPWLLLGGDGEVKVYERDDSSRLWMQTTTFAPSMDGPANLLDMDGNRAVVSVAGGIAVFEHDGEEWFEQAVISPAQWSARVSGDVIAVTASVLTPQLGGVNLWGLKDSEWVLLETVVPQGEYLDFMAVFGSPLAIDGDMLIVASTVSDELSMMSSTSIFKRHGDRWFLQEKVGGSNLGGAIDISGNLALIGAPSHNAPTEWGGGAGTGGVFVRDLSQCLDDEPAPTIPGDLTGDGNVSVPDLLMLLQAWGECADCSNCPADLTGDCKVGVPDLLILLSNWTT